MSLRIGMLVLLFAMSTVPVLAAPITFSGTLLGANEEPPNVSPATGFALVTIDDVAHTLEVDVQFADLVGPTTVAHIHVINGPGDLDTSDTVGPVATTTPTFPLFPSGVMSGVYFNVFNTLADATYRPGFLTDSGGTAAKAEDELFAAIMEGRAYFNIHSTFAPGGEIRDFLTPVPAAIPEPTSLLLMGTALAALSAARRRRRNRSIR